MKPNERVWLDDQIRNGPSLKDESARSAWKKAVVEGFLITFLPSSGVYYDDAYKSRTVKVRYCPLYCPLLVSMGSYDERLHL